MRRWPSFRQDPSGAVDDSSWFSHDGPSILDQSHDLAQDTRLVLECRVDVPEYGVKLDKTSERQSCSEVFLIIELWRRPEASEEALSSQHNSDGGIPDYLPILLLLDGNL